VWVGGRKTGGGGGGFDAGGVESLSSATERHLQESYSKVTRLFKVQTVVHLLLQCVRDWNNGEA